MQSFIDSIKFSFASIYYNAKVTFFNKENLFNLIILVLLSFLTAALLIGAVIISFGALAMQFIQAFITEQFESFAMNTVDEIIGSIIVFFVLALIITSLSVFAKGFFGIKFLYNALNLRKMKAEKLTFNKYSGLVLLWIRQFFYVILLIPNIKLLIIPIVGIAILILSILLNNPIITVPAMIIVVIAFLAYFCAVIYYSLRFYFAQVIYLTKKCSQDQALQESLKVSKGKVIDILKNIIIVGLIWMILIIILSWIITLLTGGSIESIVAAGNFSGLILVGFGIQFILLTILQQYEFIYPQYLSVDLYQKIALKKK